MNNIIKGAREQISLIKVFHSLARFAIPTPHSVPVHVPGLHPSGPLAAGREIQRTGVRVYFILTSKSYPFSFEKYIV